MDIKPGNFPAYRRRRPRLHRLGAI
jgi:hypothetical protein